MTDADRAAIVEALHGYMTRAWSGHTEADCRGIADSLAPVVDRLCDQRAAEAVERVKRLIAFYDRHEYASLNVDDLRAALAPAADGGDPA